MIQKSDLEALHERAIASHHTMRQVCQHAGVWPQSWYRAFKRGRMDYVPFRKLTDAMAEIEGKRA